MTERPWSEWVRSMPMRTKVVLLVGLLFALLILIEVAIQQFVLMPSFAELERSAAQTSMKRIRYALDHALQALELNAREWSNWGELYQFMQDSNPAFLGTYTTADATTPLKLNVLMLVDAQGKVVFSTARVWETGEPLDLDFAKQTALPPDFPWRSQLAGGSSAHGIIRTNQGILLLAGAPILNGSGGGRPLGMTIMGRLLSGDELKLIGTEAQAELTLQQISGDRRYLDLVETGSVTRVVRSFDDLYGHPVMALKIDQPRSITMQGRLAVTYSSLYLFGAGLAILALLLVVLNHLVLRRLERVTRHAGAVGEGADLAARLAATSPDEIGQLSREFDRMVEKVLESRRQLAEQSFRAGFAELAKGVMHDLGNAMTPLSVRLELLRERLSSLPLDDVRAAAAELAAGPTEAQRTADLIEFLKLGALEIEHVLAAARADATAMERQAAVARGILCAQLTPP